MTNKTLFEEAIKLLEDTSDKKCNNFIEAINTDRMDIEALTKLWIAGFSNILEFIDALSKRIEALEQNKN